MRSQLPLRPLLFKALAVFFLCALSLPAAAAPASDNLRQKIKDWQARQDWAGEGSYSGITFEEKAFEKIFDRREFPLLRFGFGWYPVPNLCLVSSIGGMYQRGYAVGAITGASSGEKVELYVLPVQINLRYRFSFMDDQIIVPSVWAGVDYWYFQENNEFSDNVDGDKSGYHYGADLAFLLDKLDPAAAARMESIYGVASTYLFAGYEKLVVGEEEEGLKFTGELYTVGLRFEIKGKR